MSAENSDRDVPVSKEFFAEMAEHLQPGERWDDNRSEPSLILHVKDYPTGRYRKLVFVISK